MSVLFIIGFGTDLCGFDISRFTLTHFSFVTNLRRAKQSEIHITKDMMSLEDSDMHYDQKSSHTFLNKNKRYIPQMPHVHCRVTFLPDSSFCEISLVWSFVGCLDSLN